MVGPMDFTTNDECGVLVEGFERPPIILTNWTHRYYPALLEGAGMAKAMDTLMWELDDRRPRQGPPGDLDGRRARRVQARDRRAADAQEGHSTPRSTASSRSTTPPGRRTGASSPLTEKEVRHYAKTLKPLLDENWALIAEKDGETVGAALTLPDYNQVLAHMNGRLLPFGWLKFLWYKRKIDRVRVFALGVKPEYQHTGVAARFYELHFDSAEVTPQTYGEMGWILETNKSMNRAMEGMGGTVVRRYRLYERLFEEAEGGEESIAEAVPIGAGAPA